MLHQPDRTGCRDAWCRSAYDPDVRLNRIVRCLASKIRIEDSNLISSLAFLIVGRPRFLSIGNVGEVEEKSSETVCNSRSKTSCKTGCNSPTAGCNSQGEAEEEGYKDTVDEGTKSEDCPLNKGELGAAQF